MKEIIVDKIEEGVAYIKETLETREVDLKLLEVRLSEIQEEKKKLFSLVEAILAEESMLKQDLEAINSKLTKIEVQEQEILPQEEVEVQEAIEEAQPQEEVETEGILEEEVVEETTEISEEEEEAVEEVEEEINEPSKETESPEEVETPEEVGVLEEKEEEAKEEAAEVKPATPMTPRVSPRPPFRFR